MGEWCDINHITLASSSSLDELIDISSGSDDVDRWAITPLSHTSPWRRPSEFCDWSVKTPIVPLYPERWYTTKPVTKLDMTTYAPNTRWHVMWFMDAGLERNSALCSFVLPSWVVPAVSHRFSAIHRCSYWWLRYNGRYFISALVCLILSCLLNSKYFV